MFSFGKSSTKNMHGIDDRLLQIASLAIKISLIDFGIPSSGGLRSESTQFNLFITRKSKCDGVTHRSLHQDGRALDFYAYVDGKASWNTEQLTHIAAAFLQAASILGISIRWGGLFKPDGWDKPHIELIG